MKTPLAYRSVKLGAVIIVLLGVIALAYSGTLAFSVVSTPIPEPELLAGITLANSFDEADAAYLQTSLRWLRDYLPEWYAYMNEAKPFIVSIGQTDNVGWSAANSTCCDEQGNGQITFDDHLDSLTASDSAEDQSPPARQVLFLSMLIHEATHLRDHRAGRIPAKIDAAACIAAEGAAYVKEFEFKRVLASASFANGKIGTDYRSAAKRQLDAEESQFNRQFWKLYCIIAHPNIMDD